MCSGAGIGGLVLAITIGKFAGCNIHIDLYEAYDAVTTAGAGVSLWRRATEIIEELGMYEEFSRVSTKPSSSHGLLFRKSNSPEGGFEWFRYIFEPYGPSQMHRQHLVDVLKKNVPSSCTMHFSKRLTKYDMQSQGSLVLHFADDSTATADVLVGADGLHSAVRKTLFESIDPGIVDPSRIRHYSDPSWTGTLVYRTVVPAEKLSKVDPNNAALKDFLIFCGKGKHIVSFPVSQGTQINVVAFVSDEQKAGTHFEGHWVSDVTLEEVEEAYQDFEPDVRRLLKSHAMKPHLGAGAGQAIEDAFVLGRLLAHPLTTFDNVPAALKAYQDVRLPFAQFVARESERIGYMYNFCSPGYYDGTDQGNEREEREILKGKIIDLRDWAAEGGAVAEWVKAERQLQEGLCHEPHENGGS
ncbi:hypothetical protein EDB19DRAFT_1906310 [Suillus lakei]|nr:hypothetical protein EDB19DRAFT_1906310 [Suillus lakei]